MIGRAHFVAFSVAAHFGLAFGLGRLEVKQSHAATAIEIASLPKAQKKAAPEPAKVDPEPPRPAARKVAARAAAPVRAANTPPPPQAASGADSPPDFGLAFSGGVGGDGVAIPGGGARAGAGIGAKAPPSVRRALTQAAAAPGATECGEPQAKPRPRSVPQPAYTMEARTAGIEGKVRVRLTVDETGKVVEVAVIQGLGYGLDEAALAAARAATFEPAVHCGKAVRATFTISMRFTAA